MWLSQDGETRGSAVWVSDIPTHAGLGYSRGAPLPVLLARDDQGATARGEWLNRLTRCREPERYAHAYRRWRESLMGPNVSSFLVRALGRVLVGHGNPTATEVGLTLHHTWGVPVLPGSALKGLTANYVQAVYGPAPEEENREREPFRGVTWKDSRPVRGPGAAFRLLFGAPDVEDPHEEASEGKILFHDALWVPASEGGSSTLLARDVLTVHQRRYYEGGGKEWPGDFDDPNPVSFLTVAPEGRFLVALEVAPGLAGGQVLLKRVTHYLKEALGEWGVGGKTAAGYGRFTPVEAAPPRVVRIDTPVLGELRAWLDEQRALKVPQREQFQHLEAEWRARLLGLAGAERRTSAHLLKQYFNLKREEEQQRMKELLHQLLGDRPSG